MSCGLRLEPWRGVYVVFGELQRRGQVLRVQEFMRKLPQNGAVCAFLLEQRNCSEFFYMAAGEMLYRAIKSVHQLLRLCYLHQSMASFDSSLWEVDPLLPHQKIYCQVALLSPFHSA